MINIKLSDVKLNNDNGRYSLDLKYTVDSDRDISVTTIRKLHLPINDEGFNVISEGVDYLRFAHRVIDVGYGYQRYDEIISEVIEEKIKEVTMTDIEEKFGCKVKIVKEKE